MSRLIELAARAWPADQRAEIGDELVDTATRMAAEGSTLRESSALLRSGMRARFRQSTNGRRTLVWESGLRVALFGSLAITLAQITVALVTGPSGDISRWDAGLVAGFVLLLATMLVLALGRSRLGAAAATCGAAAMIAWNPVDARPELAIILGVHLIALWLLALRGARASWTLVARILGLTTIAAAAGLALDNFWVGSAGVPVVASVIAVAVAVWDPRLLAAMTCFWLLQTSIMLLISVVQAHERLTQPGMYVPMAMIAIGAAGVTRSTRPRPA